MLDGLVAAVAVRERCQVALVEAETMDRGKKWRIEGPRGNRSRWGDGRGARLRPHSPLTGGYPRRRRQWWRPRVSSCAPPAPTSTSSNAPGFKASLQSRGSY